MMMRLIFLFFAATYASHAHADEWPASIFAPALSLDSGPGKLCETYEIKVRSEYFLGHPERKTYSSDFQAALNYADETSDKLSRSESDVFSFTLPKRRYFGDIDGDGSREEIFVHKYYSSRTEGDRIFLGLTKLSALDVERIRDEWKEMAEEKAAKHPKADRRIDSLFRDSSYDPYAVVAKYGVSTGRIGFSKLFETEPRDLPISKEHKEIAEAAFTYSNALQFTEHDSRIYADTIIEESSLPSSSDRLSTKSFRVLLSFDQQMRPKAECIVTASPDRLTLTPFLFGEARIAAFAQGAQKVGGREGHCSRSSLNPWLHVKQSRELLLLDAQTRPWMLGLKNRRHPGTQNLARKGLNGIPQWLRVWRLISAPNDVAYQGFMKAKEDARKPLVRYYKRNFGVPRGLAEEWAGHAVDAIFTSSALRSTSKFEKYRSELDSIDNNSANADDFLTIASVDYLDSNYSSSAPERDQRRLDRAFSYAAAAGADTHILRELLDFGAKVDSGNESALMVSVRNPRIVYFLLGNGADPNRPNVFGKTPLMMAAQLGQFDSAALLLAHGADPNLQTLASGKFLAEDSEQGKSVDVCDYDIKYGKRTAMMYAAENASHNLVELLRDAGADPTARDDGHRNVLDYLNRNERLDKSQMAKIRRLIEKKERVNFTD